MNPPLAIGIDLGGTNIKAAVVDRDGNILHRHEQPTAAARGPGPVLDDLADIVRRLSSSPPQGVSPGDSKHLPLPPGEGRGEGTIDRVIGIGLATPGPLDLREGRIVLTANLPGWKDVPIRNALREKTGLPVTLENDANAAAFGEYRAGAGRGDDHLVMLTLGTGVGAGVILNGRILHGHFDNAAELGHMIVVVDGLPCPCGQRGCLEQYASANAIVRRVADLNRDRYGAVPRSAEDVAKAAADGDSICERVWDEACLYLAIACVNIQHVYNPSKIVLGGGLSNAGAQLLDRVNAHFRKHTWSLHADAPEIVLAQLGPDAGVIGAAMLAMPLIA
jgi:glucokinase